ncbi:response regulator [Thalassotalea sp. 1_MG-2023]|uniref:response regulator n=1 Tax=Thalassotalea sp. 1_MG-2023 TaxID=3062680 RepID=UPI0026E1209C|nr:response regulator [Thalassotalea sp. 1_MG-2023]MDO6425607.1 response regulator [Thalassotalea sp. 1_MG-2023]
MTDTRTILMIDDDKTLTDLLCEYLSYEGFQLEARHDGISGLAAAKDSKYSLILLDVMMPGLNGFELLKALGGKHATPILMLTAKGDETDKVLGLELGADDYLAKPFQHRELLARINAILRRIDIVQQQQNHNVNYHINHVQMNPATHEVHCHDQLIELTGTEYQLLTLLMENSGSIVSKELISQQVMQRKLSPFDRSIDMHVSNIRRKFSAYAQDDKIKTIRGAGYIFLSGNE